MSDRGPFSMDHDPGRARVERLARELLKAAAAVARRQMDGKPVAVAGGVPGASVHERTAVSVAVQAIWNVAADDKYVVFNILDGLAHAAATTVAQMPDEARDSALILLAANTRGYELRTRSALGAKAGAGETH